MRTMEIAPLRDLYQSLPGAILRGGPEEAGVVMKRVATRVIANRSSTR